VAEFDRAPCAVATIEELLGALAPAYDIITGTTLRPEGTPAGSTFPARMPEAAACRFALAATNTDSAEAFHSVTVTVTRWRDGGSGLLGTCQTAAMAQPARYPAVRLGDEACLGPGALLPIRLDARYYTVGVTARPGHADATDDDLRIGTLTRAAAEVVATRLPRT
jgi:hypothetical protein